MTDSISNLPLNQANSLLYGLPLVVVGDELPGDERRSLPHLPLSPLLPITNSILVFIIAVAGVVVGVRLLGVDVI